MRNIRKAWIMVDCAVASTCLARASSRLPFSRSCLKSSYASLCADAGALSSSKSAGASVAAAFRIFDVPELQAGIIGAP